MLCFQIQKIYLSNPKIKKPHYYVARGLFQPHYCAHKIAQKHILNHKAQKQCYGKEFTMLLEIFQQSKIQQNQDTLKIVIIHKEKPQKVKNQNWFEKIFCQKEKNTHNIWESDLGKSYSKFHQIVEEFEKHHVKKEFCQHGIDVEFCFYMTHLQM